MRRSLLRVLFALAPVSTFYAAPSLAGTKLTLGPGSTGFLAIGRPSMLRIHGEGQGPSGELEVDGQSVQGAFEMDVSSFSTGIDLRDRHMKEKYLEVEKFKNAKLVLKKLSLPAPLKKLFAGSESVEVPFDGEMELHGVRQDVHGSVAMKPKDGGQIAFEAKFPIEITRFKIEVPSYLGIKIADKVEVDVKSEVAGALN